MRHTIEKLHSTYVDLTGQFLFLNAAREREWFDWLKFRQPPFTVDDLRAVIFHLKHGIKADSRRPGCLKFRNLIGQPDYFEEDLAEATARNRPKQPTHKEVQTGMTRRIVPSTGCEANTRSAADVISDLKKLKEAIL